MMTYTERAAACPSSCAKELFLLMDEKKTNLALSADVTNAEALLEIAQQLGSEICILKTHIDIIEDFTPALTQELSKIAKKHHFLIFEDRKFADIGNTVKHQYRGGLYRIADWADMINAHALPGPGIIQGLTGEMKESGLILIAEMSSSGHLMNQQYMLQTLALANQFPEVVIGFITQHALTSDCQWINFTPGIKLDVGEDSLGQRYITPKQAIGSQGTDVIIVGRGILSAENSLAEARRYRQAGWESYVNR